MTPGGTNGLLALWGPAKKTVWPLAKQAVVVITAYVAKHPETQESFARFARRLSDAQKARTPEARIRRGLGPIREHAREVVDSAGKGTADAVQAQGWLQRADQIERALEIVEHRPRAERRERLRAVTGMADALVAEVMLALVPPGP